MRVLMSVCVCVCVCVRERERERERARASEREKERADAELTRAPPRKWQTAGDILLTTGSGRTLSTSTLVAVAVAAMPLSPPEPTCVPPAQEPCSMPRELE